MRVPLEVLGKKVQKLDFDGQAGKLAVLQCGEVGVKASAAVLRMSLT